MHEDEPAGRTDLRTAATQAVNAAGAGRRAALDCLFEQRYDEMRALARQLSGPEGRAVSINPTALVHEAYARLIDASHVSDRGSVFFRACFATVVRRLLVERARARNALRRGGGRRRKTVLESGDLQIGDGLDLVELHETLEDLAAVPRTGARMAQVVELRVFAGMTVPECAEALGVSPRTVDTDWILARTFLQARLRQT